MTTAMPTFTVHLKNGRRPTLRAVDLRDAQDRAFELYGPYAVIAVTEPRHA